MLSDEQLEQRQQAARTHGAHSFEARGVEALTNEQRPIYTEIREQVQTRDGVLELLKEQTVKAVMMVELLTAYAVESQRAGVPLDDIKTFNRLPAFFNSAHRALKILLDEQTAGKGSSAEMDKIKQVIDELRD